MKTRRIQRKRTKGWRMPPNTIYVGRGSKWGNPYKLFQKGALNIPLLREEVKYHYRLDIELSDHKIAVVKKELKGKNLACYCKLDQPCHADILLDIAGEK